MAVDPESLVCNAEHLVGDGRAALLDATIPPKAKDSWRLYREVGEYNAATEWIGNGLGELMIQPQRWLDGEWVIDTDPTAIEVMRQLGETKNLLTAWGKNSVITGEAFLVLADGLWSIRSRSELDRRTNNIYLDEYGVAQSGARARRDKTKPTGPLVRDLWRFWLPDTQYTKQASTPVYAFQADLEQLRLLRLVLNSKLNTRLWLNGILFLSQQLSLPTQGSDGQAGKGASVITRLRRLFEENIKRRESAKDSIPILVQTSTQEVKGVIEAWYPETSIDEREAELRREIRATLRELLDMPVELQTSMGQSNRWNSWSIPEVNKIYSLMPRAKGFLYPLSYSWYRAQLIKAGMSAGEASLRRLSPDASGLRGEASSDEARLAHDRGAINDMALRKATRAPETAKPEGDEAVRQLGWKTNDPYLALWGTPEHDKIDWSMVGTKRGAPGIGTDRPDRGPGVGDPGSPTDPNSEVGDG